jgi:thiosulfate/3-mercaptopyruvate sulfurtransferase
VSDHAWHVHDRIARFGYQWHVESTCTPSTPPFVDVAWVRAHPGTVVADVRWQLIGPSGREAYEQGHIPGAVFVDLDADLATITVPEEGRHPLPSPDAFARAMAALGIGDADTVVAYDDAGGIFAARLAWMLRAIGRPAAVLDGGLAAWDGPLERGLGAARPVATFTAAAWPAALLAGIDEVSDAPTPVIDARAAERYRGETEPVDPRAGHIPGAINVPCMLHLRHGHLLPPDDLRAQFAAAGITSADAAIAYCGSGVNACHSLLVMEHAGLGRGRLFPGSWSAWSNRPERDAAVGPAAPGT